MPSVPAAVLSVRVSASERALLEAAAEQARTNLSDFVRQRALEAAETDLLDRRVVTIPAKDWAKFEAWASRRRRMCRRFANWPRAVPSGRSEGKGDDRSDFAKATRGRRRHGGVRLWTRCAESLVPAPCLAQPGVERVADHRGVRSGNRRHRRLCELVGGANRAGLAAQGSATQPARPYARNPARAIGGRYPVAAARWGPVPGVLCTRHVGALVQGSGQHLCAHPSTS